MKRYKFLTNDDVRDFLEELINEDMIFHLDDDVEDIVWTSKKVSKKDIYLLKLNMIDLWNFCDPWLVMSCYPETENRYLERE